MKLKKVMMFCLALTVLIAVLGMPAYAETSEEATGDISTETADTAGTATQTESSKNETVYGMLNGDGSVDEIYVVNQLIGEYTDYGTYSEIKNLSTDSVPVTDGDQIVFPDEYVEGGLYYQGTMQGELPMVFDIRYFLDGEPVSASDIAGASEHLCIEIEYSQNEECDESVREGLSAQISIALSLDKASEIVADGATTVMTGSTVSIGYTILAGESGEKVLEADISDFEMDAITITLVKGTLSIDGFEENIEELEDGFDELINGAGELADGTSELKDGTASLASGIGDVYSGMSQLSSSGEEIQDGLSDFADGLDEYTSGTGTLTSASAQMQSGLDDLAENGTDVAAGVAAVSSGLSSLASSDAELRALAESLLTSSDPSVQALAQGMLQTLNTVDQLSDGLSEASQGVTAYTAGVQQAAEEYHTFHAGMEALDASGGELVSGYAGLESGFDSYLDGIESATDGTYALYQAIESLPNNIQKLIDGQIEFKDGLITAKTSIVEQIDEFMGDDDTSAVSFTSPEKNHPDSVQYVLTTPAISVEQESEATEETTEDGDFFSRLLDLFRW